MPKWLGLAQIGLLDLSGSVHHNFITTTYLKTEAVVILKISQKDHFNHLDVSENSVPLNPMVNDHYPYLNGYNWEYTIFSDKPTYNYQ